MKTSKKSDKNTTKISSDELIYLAVDPGSKKLGWAIILDGTKPKKIASGLIKPREGSTSNEDRIDASGFDLIYNEITDICSEYKPNRCLVEHFGVNRPRTGMFVVPRVKAIVELAWYHYSKTIPTEVIVRQWKLGLTGNPKSEKPEVVQKLTNMGITITGTSQDEYDAIGIGIGWLTVNSNSRSIIGPRVRKSTRKG